MMKRENNECESEKRNYSVHFTCDGFCILHLHILSYPSESMIRMWTWYYSVDQTTGFQWFIGIPNYTVKRPSVAHWSELSPLPSFSVKQQDELH